MKKEQFISELFVFILLSAITIFLWWFENQKSKKGDLFNWPLLLLPYPFVFVISSIFKDGIPISTSQVIKITYILIWVSGLIWSLSTIRRYRRKI